MSYTITAGYLTAHDGTPPRYAFNGAIKAGDSISGVPNDYYGLTTYTIGVISGFFTDEDGDVVALCPYSVCNPKPETSGIGKLVYRPAIYDNPEVNLEFTGWPDNPANISALPYFGTIKRAPMIVPYKTERTTFRFNTGAQSFDDPKYITSGVDFCTVKVHPYFLKYKLIDPQYTRPDNSRLVIQTDINGYIKPYSFELGSSTFTNNGPAIFSAMYQNGVVLKHAYDRLDEFKSAGIEFAAQGYYGYPQVVTSSPFFNNASTIYDHKMKNILQANFNAIPVTMFTNIASELYYIYVNWENGLIFNGYPWNSNYLAGLYPGARTTEQSIFLNYSIKLDSGFVPTDPRILLDYKIRVPMNNNGVLLSSLPNYNTGDIPNQFTPMRSYGAIILDNRGYVVPHNGVYEAILYYKLKPLKL